MTPVNPTAPAVSCNRPKAARSRLARHLQSQEASVNESMEALMLRSRCFTSLMLCAALTAGCQRDDGDGGTDDDTASAQSASEVVESGG